MALCASISAPKGFANIIPPLPTTAQVEKLYIDGRSCCGNALLCSQGGVRRGVCSALFRKDEWKKRKAEGA